MLIYKGKPLGQVNTEGWHHSLRRTGIANVRWRGLRHTWASWLVQQGTKLYDLQEMGGWKTAVMVGRYANPARANMARHSRD
ncbi:tyrosine-type recombinase/integrase [Massilia solisilvae]|uniref:Tyrosine-type recombinase/integrase n=1 Tax=Massilia solisilvae TaxID=1811225 RepID=A0ABT2BJX9_9BURK|nr:tyrosine-type recombinase/integrase [Massilia solisilvae]